MAIAIKLMEPDCYDGDYGPIEYSCQFCTGTGTTGTL